MAAAFVDLDGTIFSRGTEEFLPGAKAGLLRFHRAGHQLIFTTRRTSTLSDVDSLRKLLQRIFPGCVLIVGVESPRILINDEGAAAIQHEPNAPWQHDLLQIVQGLT